MVEPPVFLCRPLPEESERGADPVAGLAPGHPAVLGADAYRGQTEARGSDACRPGMLVIIGHAVGLGPVQNQSGVGISLFPEVAEGAVRQLLEKSLVLGAEGPHKLRGAGRRRFDSRRGRRDVFVERPRNRRR